MTADLANAWQGALSQLPLVAILRGLRPDEADAVGDALWAAGWRLLEVPLNSPQPLDSIARLARRFPQAIVGAGTVRSAEEVRQVHAAGGLMAPQLWHVGAVRTRAQNWSPPGAYDTPAGRSRPDN